MQPQMAVTLALSNGTSVISESIFENRFRYVDELTKMGATIQVDGRTAIISGVEGFTGADVHAPDLRAGAALVIAGLSAKGFTTVSDIGYIYRGYEQFEQKLKQLGGELCQIGGAVESVLGCPIEEEDLPKLIGFLKRQETNGKFFSKAMQKEPLTDMEEV